MSFLGCGMMILVRQKRLLMKYVQVGICDSIDRYAKEKSRLRKEGSLIDDFDLLIGCAALARDLVLVTDNEKHFSRIVGLKMENWIRR